MTKGCNIRMICLILIWFFYGLSRVFQLPQFVWALRFSLWGVFINFLLIDATDKSKISIDQKRFFVALSLYPLSFFANTPFNKVQKSELNHQIFKLEYFQIVSNIAFFVCNPIIYSLMNMFLEIIFYFYFLSLAVIKQNELNARLSLLNPDELHGLNTLCLQGTLFTELFSMFCKTPICNYLVNMHRH